MAWGIRFSKEADKALVKLDKKVANRILNELERIIGLDDPRSVGKLLTGNYSGLWRYRVGSYRIICDLVDDELVVLVMDVGHRSKIYKSWR